MEEKLNMIYAKLLEIENSMIREQEYNDELLTRFRSIGNQMQVEESE